MVEKKQRSSSPGALGNSFQDAALWWERSLNRDHGRQALGPAPGARARSGGAGGGRGGTPVPSEWGGEGRESSRTERKKGSPRISPHPLSSASEKLGGGQARSKSPWSWESSASRVDE